MRLDTSSATEIRSHRAPRRNGERADGTQQEEVTPIPRIKSKPRLAAAASQTLLDLTEKTLDDGKAEDVVVIDLQGKSSIADHMVIATGRSQRQVVSLAERLLEALKLRWPWPSRRSRACRTATGC